MNGSERMPENAREVVHWIGDAPTSLHGNGAASFEHTSRDPAEVTCGLCLTLLARNEQCIEGHGCDGRSHSLHCNERAYSPSDVPDVQEPPC